MRKAQEKSKDQARWNRYGIEMIRKIEKDPEKYIISNCPLSKVNHKPTMRPLDY